MFFFGIQKACLKNGLPKNAHVPKAMSLRLARRGSLHLLLSNLPCARRLFPPAMPPTTSSWQAVHALMTAMRRTPTLRHNEMATTLMTEVPQLECFGMFCAVCPIPEVRWPVAATLADVFFDCAQRTAQDAGTETTDAHHVGVNCKD